MNTLIKQCLKPFMFLLLAMSFTYSSASLADKAPTANEVRVMSHQVMEYLSTIPLQPYVQGDNWNFQLTGQEKLTDSAKVVFAELSKGKDNYKIAILMNKVGLQLLYIGDIEISTQLFMDLLTPALATANADPAKIGFIFMKNKSHEDQKGGVIEWIFVDNKENKSVEINLTPDGNGGTNYSIAVPKA